MKRNHLIVLSAYLNFGAAVQSAREKQTSAQGPVSFGPVVEPVLGGRVDASDKHCVSDVPLNHTVVVVPPREIGAGDHPEVRLDDVCRVEGLVDLVVAPGDPHITIW